MALAETLNQGNDPFAAIGRVSRGQDVLTRSKQARTELEPMLRGEAQAREQFALEELGAKQKKAKAESLAEEQFATEKRTATQEYQTGLPQRPRFDPTQFDAAEAGNLAGLTAVIGAVVGRNSARSALRSMAGFTKGAREGRADLYDKEAKQFEASLSEWRDNVKMADERLRQVIDLLSTDKTAALTKAKELEPMLQSGVVLAKIRQQNYAGAAEDLRNMNKVGEQAELAFIKATQSGAKEKEPSKEERDRIALRQSIKNRIPALIQAVKANEGTLGLKTLLNEQIISRIDVGGVPLRSALAQMDADYRFSKGGKALTKNENEILRGVTDWKGKQADAIIKQLRALNEYVDTDQNVYRQLYPDFMSRLTNAAPSAGANPPKTATMRNVRATAKTRGITEDEAKNLYIERGFTITGE
jgi:hypothetical protein